MNLSISGHHLDVTPALREYVTGKLDRVIRHFDQVIDIRVILSTEAQNRKAEINLHVRGKDLHVESTHEDLYAAIDALVDKLDRQVIKYKTLRTEHQHEAVKRQPIST